MRPTAIALSFCLLFLRRQKQLRMVGIQGHLHNDLFCVECDTDVACSVVCLTVCVGYMAELCKNG